MSYTDIMNDTQKYIAMRVVVRNCQDSCK